MNTNKFKELTDHFEEILLEDGDPDEKYKYLAITTFQENWKLESPGFPAMLKKSLSKVTNLLYPSSKGFIDKAAQSFPEEVRKMFRKLYDESKDLKSRIQSFHDDSEILLPAVREKLGTEKLKAQQDERTVSLYLAFRYPEKYILYKSSVYEQFCKFLLINPKATGERFIHFLQLAEEFRKSGAISTAEFLDIYRKFYPKPEWDDGYLMIQNIIYVSLRDEPGGLQNDDDLVNSLSTIPYDHLESYYLFLDKIIDRFNLSTGDERLVFNFRKTKKRLLLTIGPRYVFITSNSNFEKNFGAISTAPFTGVGAPFEGKPSMYWNQSDEFSAIEAHENSVFSGIEQELKDARVSPFRKHSKKLLEKMAFDKVYRATILERVKDTEYGLGIKNYWIFQSNPKVYDLPKALQANILTGWKVAAHKKSIKAGDKVILWITGPDAGIYALAEVTSEVYNKAAGEHETDFEYYLEIPTKPFDQVDLKLEHNLVAQPLLKSTLQNYPWFSGMNVGQQGTNFKSSEKEYKELDKLISAQKKMKIKSHALNSILYGPPGTGKTYHTINKAISIINPAFDLNQERSIIKKEYQRLVEKGRIVFTTFHQSMTYEDFIEGIKPLTPESDDTFIKYDVRPGIFKNICTAARTKAIKADNFQTVYQKLLEEIDASPSKSLVLETLVHSKEFTIYKNSKDNLKFHANTEKAYEGVIRKEVIEHFLKTGESLDWTSYTRAVGKHIVDKYHFSVTEEESAQEPYVLIIDEINRGNVSQIFGELITLIEEDKRLGNDEALEIKLPYSKTEFGVPSNLYIIGTMNTADRSVEALDTALRRRFSFEEMPPKYDLAELDYDIYGYKAADLLHTINRRIKKLIDGDHAIGHAYFIRKDESTIADSFYLNIIPLLQEYFFGDYGKIGLVLGKGFIRLTEDDNAKLFADFDYENAADYSSSEVFEIVDYRKSETLGTMGEAIKILMNK